MDSAKISNILEKEWDQQQHNHAIFSDISGHGNGSESFSKLGKRFSDSNDVLKNTNKRISCSTEQRNEQKGNFRYEFVYTIWIWSIKQQIVMKANTLSKQFMEIKQK